MSMKDVDFNTRLHKLWTGFRLRCPNCEKGAMFDGLFTLRDTCPVCNVRFERSDGESLGGMMLNLVAVELVTVGGFILSQWLLEPPLMAQLVFWTLFNLVFIFVFYRHARGLWIAVTYLTGGVYADPPDPSAPPL